MIHRVDCGRCVASRVVRKFSSGISIPRDWNVLSGLFVPTLREDPSDAVAVSHKLLVRAGYVRQSSAGIFSFLPLGNRLLGNISRVVEEEMEGIGCRQVSLPLLLSEELWRRTGRWQEYGDELMRMKDRKGNSYCLAPTHEEAISDLVASNISSYRQLPLRLYQIGRKYRDEVRPRFGLMRGREFVMKDLYTFDRTREDAIETYEQVSRAYERIFSRLGLDWVRCVADSGAIGGNLSHEYQVRCPAGEDILVNCEKCGYQANIEKAAAGPRVVCQNPEDQLVARHIEGIFILPSGPVSCSAVVVLPENAVLNNISLAHALGVQDVKNSRLSQVSENLLRLKDLPSVVREEKRAIVVDSSVSFEHPHAIRADLQFPRGVGPCDRSDCGKVLTTTAGMEVGHVFYLGTKYSSSMNVRYLDEHGKSTLVEMGCFGIGVSRLLAAIAEVHHDSAGLKWPVSVVPFHVHVVPMSEESEVLSAVHKVYNLLFSAGSSGVEDRFHTLLDDRLHLSPGSRLKDALLIGSPLVVVVGKRSLAQGQVEIQNRITGNTDLVAVDNIATAVRSTLQTIRN